MRKEETITVLICDSCETKSNMILTSCPICMRECCYLCSSQLYDVYHTNVCKKCLENPDINKDFMKLHRRWLEDRAKVTEEIALAHCEEAQCSTPTT